MNKLKEKIKNPLNFFYKGFFLTILAWIFIVPLAFVIPKKKNLVIFWGRDGGKFTDNVKYLYLYAQKDKDIDSMFLTNHEEVYESLNTRKYPVLLCGKLFSFFMMLRASVVIADSIDWINDVRFHFFYGAKKVQLWHGVGLKAVELESRHEKELLKYKTFKAFYFLKGRFPLYDVVVSTSEYFSKKGYVNGLKHKKIEILGYSRNDVFFMDNEKLNDDYLLGSDRKTLKKVQEYKKQNKNIVIYVPTFRDSGKDSVGASVLNIEKLDKFCEKNDIIFIFKTHSWGMLKDEMIKTHIQNATNVMFYDNSKDVYPLLSYVDVMISDYSSIYMDFLLLNKPILFFSYDLKEYESKERGFYFDYDALTPGRKCNTQEELQKALEKILLHQQDDFKDERKSLRQLTFQDCDGGSSLRVWNCVKKILGD